MHFSTWPQLLLLSADLFPCLTAHLRLLPAARCLQSCVKFLEVAATMEAYPPKFSREQ